MGDKIDKKRSWKKVSSIAKYLGVEFLGPNVKIDKACSLNDAGKHALVFSKKNITNSATKKFEFSCFITKEPPDCLGKNAFIIVDNPRLAFAKCVCEFFSASEDSFEPQNTVIDPTAKIGSHVIIGHGCVIGRNVVIGNSTVIRNNVILGRNSKLGSDCLIKSNSVIGEEGFGFDYEVDGTPFRMPHLGGVQIGDFVEIGALNTIDRGTLRDTVVQSHVKTDEHVHIGHNCVVGRKTMITACAEISGSVVIGNQCWLGPNCSIMNKITLGDDVYIGLGAVVLNDVPSHAVMVGNPAKILRYNRDV